MDQNGGVYPSTPVSDATNQVPAPQYAPNQSAEQQLSQLRPQLQMQPQAQPQPTNFDMVTPVQRPASPIFTNEPVTQNFAQPQPANYEQQNQIPAATLQPANPYMTENDRPAWQQELLQEISNNQYQPAEPMQPTSPAAAYSAPSYGQPLQQYASNKFDGQTQNIGPYYDNASGDQVPQYSSGSTVRTWLIRAIVLIVLLGLLGGGGFGAYRYGYKTGYTKGVRETKLANAAQNDSTNSGNQTDKQPELSFELVEPAYKAETITGGAGEQLQSSDGFVIKVKDVERNYQPSDTSYQLETNKELIKVNFLIGNAAAARPRKITNDNFTLKGPVSEVINYESKLTNFEGYINTLTLSSGSQAQISVVFAVDADASPLTLVWQQPYTLQAEAATVTMSIEVVL